MISSSNKFLFILHFKIDFVFRNDALHSTRYTTSSNSIINILRFRNHITNLSKNLNKHIIREQRIQRLREECNQLLKIEKQQLLKTIRELKQ